MLAVDLTPEDGQIASWRFSQDASFLYSASISLDDRRTEVGKFLETTHIAPNLNQSFVENLSLPMSSANIALNSGFGVTSGQSYTPGGYYRASLGLYDVSKRGSIEISPFTSLIVQASANINVVAQDNPGDLIDEYGDLISDYVEAFVSLRGSDANCGSCNRGEFGAVFNSFYSPGKMIDVNITRDLSITITNNTASYAQARLTLLARVSGQDGSVSQIPEPTSGVIFMIGLLMLYFRFRSLTLTDA